VAVFVDRDPTPLEAVILAETVEQLIRRFDPDERPIVELSLQGYSGPEISARIGPCRTDGVAGASPHQGSAAADAGGG